MAEALAGSRRRVVDSCGSWFCSAATNKNGAERRGSLEGAGGYMRKVHTGRRASRLAGGVLVCVAAAGFSPGAHAIGFQSDSGDWVGSWDTTVGYGQAWRVEGRDCRLIAMANGGCGYGPNIDDGDLNYSKGRYSQVLTGVTEFSLKYKDRAGAFVRADGLYDFYVMGGNTERTPLTHYARDIVGSYARLLDAFGWLRFNLGSMPSEFRFGQQVVDWGESTFIAGGLNQVTYFDVNALTTPGSELKQALLPDTMARLDVQLSKNVSAQLLYLFSWHEDIVPTSAPMTRASLAATRSCSASVPSPTRASISPRSAGRSSPTSRASTACPTRCPRSPASTAATSSSTCPPSARAHSSA